MGLNDPDPGGVSRGVSVCNGSVIRSAHCAANGSKQMKYVAERCDPKEMRKELETIGSNPAVRDRKLHWFSRGA
jgi:hypothetical protein